MSEQKTTARYRIMRHDFGTLPPWRAKLHGSLCCWLAWVLGAETYLAEKEVPDA